MSLKQLFIGLTILLYGVINLRGTSGILVPAFYWAIIIVGALWMLEQLIPAVVTVKRPVRRKTVVTE